MDLHTPPCSSIFKHSALLLIFIASSEAFAINEFIEVQSSHRMLALIYGLLGLMTLLFITPFLQFYFAAVRSLGHKKEHEKLCNTRAENEALKSDLKAIKNKLQQVEKSRSRTKTKPKSGLKDNENGSDVLQKQYDAAQSEISALLSQVNSLKQHLYEKDQSIAVLDHQLSVLETEQENATSFINQLNQQLTAKNKAMTFAEAMTEQKTQISSKTRDADVIAMMQSQLDQLTSDSMLTNNRLLQENASISDELSHTKIALNKAKQHIVKLSQNSEQLDLENKQQAQLIDNLMAQISNHNKQVAI